MRTRFAPSPTGYLHIGNARTALVAWLYAHRLGGEFWLRIDDTDTERSGAHFIDAIKEDLTWLGLNGDGYFQQSGRLARYEEIKQALIKSGRLYPCYETQTELEIKRKMQLSRGQPPIYDRAALKSPPVEGRGPHYRFLLEDKPIVWQDEVRGEVHFEARNLSDPIVIRESGAYTYMLPSTVDDADHAMTHIIRGEDHVTNTAIQIQMFEALGATVPTFAHLALIQSKEGKISKREGGFDIRSLREEGIEPMALASFLGRIGTADPIIPRHNLQELVAGFDISRFSRAPAHYDIIELERVNQKLLHSLSFEEVKARLGVSMDQEFWLAVRPNITSLKEVADWWRICKEPLHPVIEDEAFAKQAAEFLPETEWDEQTWEQWVKRVSEATGRKGKQLFMPIRKALTGMDHGPELKTMLPLIGKEKAKARLWGKVA